MNNNEIYKIFKEDFPSRHFIRFGDNRHLSLYIGRDDDARYAFDFRGKYKPVRISSSDVIFVEQYKDGDVLTLRFSLENNNLLEYFCTFCQDLLDSVSVVNDDETVISYSAVTLLFMEATVPTRQCPHDGNRDDGIDR